MTCFTFSCCFFKQVHLNLDEYDDEDYVNFDMIDEKLQGKGLKGQMLVN